MGEHFFFSLSAQIAEWAWPIAAWLGVLLFIQFRAVEPEKRVFVVGMFSWFFLVIVTFWLLKPIKKALFVGYYKLHPTLVWGWSLDAAQMELLAKELNVVVALAYFMVLSWSRNSLMQGMHYPMVVTVSYGAALLAFALVAGLGGEAFVWLLYMFGDLLVVSLVAVFFSFLHTHCNVRNSRNLYALIGLGGVLGGFVGSASLSTWASAMSTEKTLTLACLLLVLTVLVQLMLGRYFRHHEASVVVSATPDFQHPPETTLVPIVGATRWGRLMHGANIVFHSRHLLLIAGMLSVYEVVSVLMDYQFTRAVTQTLAPDQFKAYFGAVFTFSNALSVLVQLILTSWLLKRYGPHVALYVMPIAILMGAGMYVAMPILLFASLLSVADNAFAYSVQQTSREALYVPTSAQEKYEAKAFIDVVWLRLSKGVAIVLGLVVSLAFAQVNTYWLSVLVMCLAAVWLYLLGKMLISYRNLTATSPLSRSEDV